MSGNRRPQDAHGKRARREGYPARSIYKLEEIDRRAHLFKQGQRVLDLGATPGSWMLYVAERIGHKGHVLGVDLEPLRISLPNNAEFRIADALTIDPASLGESGTLDVVLSDMAPSTTGHRSTDQARSFELFSRALEIATILLRPGGSFAAKIFQSGDFPEAQRAVRAAFEQARVIRPQAVRTESTETFLIGQQKK